MAAALGGGPRYVAAALAALTLGACSGEPFAPRSPALGQPIVALPEGSSAHIEVRRLDKRPRLTLVARDGDPSPAVAAVFVTDLGPGLTAALAAVMESRLKSAGFEPDVRVDRDAFRVRFLLGERPRAFSDDSAWAGALFAAIAGAAGRPVALGSPEMALAVERLQSLRRNPLDAPELAAVSACTGALGIAPGEPLPDLTTDAGARALEGARRAALHTDGTAIAVVGPTAFVAVAARALEVSQGWLAPAVASPAPAWPAADAAGVYTALGHDEGARLGQGRQRERLTVAVRVADPLAAAAAAEHLGAPDSPLVARVRLLPEAWRVAQVVGVARPHGGCVGVTLEAAQHPIREGSVAVPSPEASAQPSSAGAALAAALSLREVTAELSIFAAGAVAGRQILTAADPREAASRAAWWSLAAAAPGAPARWVAALGLPVPAGRSPRDAAAAATGPAADARFRDEIERAVATSTTAGAERRLGVERGQGELWLLLGSPCGVAEEGGLDAGFGALATLAALETRRRADGVSLDPWITADGIGVVAHAPFRDERETPADLARRVADAAARAFTAASPLPDAAIAARGAVLEHLEHTAGAQGAALAVFAAAAAPDHPSWLEPFGLWSGIAGAGPEGVRLRGQALAQGPLRLAVLANADAAQAAAAGDAVDRWLAPIQSPRVCRAGTGFASRPGHYDARLPDGAPLAQGLVGASVPPPGAPGRDLADLTAMALDGPGGLLASALADATASARLMGGARAPTLVIDVRAPAEGLGSAVADVKALLMRLATSVTEADLARAAGGWDRREQQARADPRRRLIDLWSGRPQPAPTRPSLASWRAFLGAALRDGALVVVEARSQ